MFTLRYNKRIDDTVWLVSSIAIVVIMLVIPSITDPATRFQMAMFSVVPGAKAFDLLSINHRPHPSSFVGNSNNNDRKVCFIYDNAYNDDDNNDFLLEKSQETAKLMNLPIVIVNDDDGIIICDDDADHYTHALRLVPYESSSSNLIISTYALSIEALPDYSSSSSSSNSKRRKKPPKRNRKRSSNTNPFFVDFLPSKQSRMGKRILTSTPQQQQQQQSGSDLLLQAAGLLKKKKQQQKQQQQDKRPVVLFDLTAGFGQDSVLLALSGGAQRVVMVERDPIVASLLDDALRRVDLVAATAAEPSENDNDNNDDDEVVRIAKSLSQCLSLVVGDSRTLLLEDAVKTDDITTTTTTTTTSTITKPDVVYLDPMFPPRTKSAAVKKNMQILHGLLDTQKLSPSMTKIQTADVNIVSEETAREAEESRLLTTALKMAKGRVVVKRPIKAVPLGGGGGGGGQNDNNLPSPSYAVKGSTSRWDVYIVKQ